MIARLSAVEKEVKNIKDTVNTISDTVTISLEQKLGGAVEAIENKLENFLYLQREQAYYTHEVRMRIIYNLAIEQLANKFPMQKFLDSRWIFVGNTFAFCKKCGSILARGFVFY